MLDVEEMRDKEERIGKESQRGGNRASDKWVSISTYVVSGWKNKLQSAIANVTPAGVLAEQHRKLAEPGSARRTDE